MAEDELLKWAKNISSIRGKLEELDEWYSSSVTKLLNKLVSNTRTVLDVDGDGLSGVIGDSLVPLIDVYKQAESHNWSLDSEVSAREAHFK